MENKVKAVIFDQDGLMFDTERVSKEAWQLAGKEFGIQLEESFLCTIRGRNHADCTRRFQEEFGEERNFEPLRNRKRDIFLKLLEERGVPVKPGLKELLVWLKAHGYKTVLATASTKEYSMHNLLEVGIADYFDDMVTGDMVEQAKPNPQIFYRAAALMGEKPEHCLVLEDSLNGVEAGLRGGFVTVMVPDLTQPDDALRSRVAAVCSSLLEVKELLENGRL